MTNSGGYSNADNKAEEDMKDADDATAMTESGEISTGADSNDVFSDSAPGKENPAAGGEDSKDSSNGK